MIDISALVAGACALALQPLMPLVLFDPIRNRWVSMQGRPRPPRSLPSAIRRLDGDGAATLVTEFGTLVGLMALSRASAIPLSSLWRLTKNSWLAVGSGVVLGVMFLACFAALSIALRVDFKGRLFQRMHAAAAFLIAIAAAGVEEVWRAFCLVALQGTGVFVSSVLTALSFGLAHASSVPAVLSAILFGVCAALVFWNSGGFWAPLAAHVIVDVGMVRVMRSPVAVAVAGQPVNTPPATSAERDGEGCRDRANVGSAVTIEDGTSTRIG